MSKSRTSKTVGIRLSLEDFQSLKKHSDKLGIAHTSFAKELLLNGLHRRKDTTLLDTFKDSERRNEKQFEAFKQEIQALKTNLLESDYSLATSVFIFLYKERDHEEAREYVKDLFPFWKG